MRRKNRIGRENNTRWRCRRPLWGCSIFLLGVCFLFLLWQDQRERAPGWEERLIPFTGRQTAVGEIYYRETGSEHTILYVKNVHLADAPAEGGPKRLLIYADNDSVISYPAFEKGSSDQSSGQLSIGSVVRTEGKIKYMEHETNPGQFDERTFYRARGILWKQYADDVQIVGHTGGLGAWCGEKLALFRENACGRLEKLFDSDTAGLLQAMLFGVKNNLPVELADGFSRMGTGHLLSISGLHFTLLMGTLHQVMRKLAVPIGPELVSGERKLCRKEPDRGQREICRKVPVRGQKRMRWKVLVRSQRKMHREKSMRKGLRRWACLLLVFLAIFAYIQMLGVRVSSLRAGIMLVLLLLAEGLGRSYDRVTAWGFAGLVVLVAQPWALLTSGFWLSFGVTGAVIMALEWQEEQKRREKEAELLERRRPLPKEGEILGSKDPLPKESGIAERRKLLRSMKKVLGERQAALVKDRMWVGNPDVKPDKTRKAWRSSLGIPLFIQLALLPLQLWFFYEVPVYALVWNVLLVPMAGILLGAGVLALLVSGLLDLAGHFIVTFSVFCLGRLFGIRVPGFLRMVDLTFQEFGKIMGVFLGGPAATVSEVYQLSCKVQRLLPGSVYVCGKPALWQVLFYYGVFLGVLLAGSAENEEAFGNMENATWGQGGFRRKRLLKICLPLYMAAFLCLLFYRNRPPWQVAFLDVGQGDCAVLQEESGRTVVIDCGSSDEKGVGTYRLLPYLKYMGAQKVDAVFVSHADEDHISGIRELLEQTELPVEHMVCYAEVGEKMEPLLCLAAEREVPVLGMIAGNSLHIGQMQMTCLAPGVGDISSDENNRSLVLLAEQEGVRMLFTGDMGEEEEGRLLEQIYPLTAQILKVGHHGSATSTSVPFLQEVSPGLAVISCGENNRYGHPAPETVERLMEADVRIYKTPENGAVILQIKRGKIRVNCWRK